MQEFFIIILIFLEITLVCYAVVKILEFNKKIIEYNEILLEKAKLFNEIHKKIQKTIKKINFFVSLITTGRKLWQIKKSISLAISAIELIIILKSFNYKKGVKFNLKNLKKLLFTNLSRKVLKKLFSNLILVC